MITGVIGGGVLLLLKIKFCEPKIGDNGSNWKDFFVPLLQLDSVDQEIGDMCSTLKLISR